MQRELDNTAKQEGKKVKTQTREKKNLYMYIYIDLDINCYKRERVKNEEMRSTKSTLKKGSSKG
jgi:hypothetical protein